MNSRIFPWLYDAFMRTAERGRLARWRRSVAAPATGRIIEIGAGTGLNFRHYRAGATVIASDRDLAMLRRARARARRSSADILLVAADAEALPFRAQTFDDAVVGFAFCTIPRPARAVAELRRVLHPRAACRLLEHVRVAHPVIGRLQEWATPVWRLIAGGCRLDRTTLELLAASGFSLDRVRSHVGGFVVESVARPRSLPDAAGHQEAVVGVRSRASGDHRLSNRTFPATLGTQKSRSLGANGVSRAG